MDNIFNSVQLQKPNSNVFDLSHDVKMSLNPGKLIPVLTMDVLPGDKIRVSSESMLRFAPLLAPIMHKVDVYTHFFFVPNRITWSGWEKFITNGQDGDVIPAAPTLVGFEVLPSSLLDYLGLPQCADCQVPVSALPMAAYQMIYNEYYRDQNLIDEVPFALVDGSNDANFNALSTLRTRAWRHDYFTSALPFAQKGDAVEIPLLDGTIDLDASLGTPKIRKKDGTNISAGDQNIQAAGDAGPDAELQLEGDNDPLVYDPDGTLIVNNESATINDLRRAISLQRWLELNARGGSRYSESLMVHFGVKSADGRLQRPEYLGGSVQPMVISEVLQTSQSEDTPQGNMSGHGVSVGFGKSFSYRAQEHGYVIGIMSILPKTAYQQGIPRHYLREANTDYYWPSFAHLGEQEIKNCELFLQDAGPGTNLATFGYVPRYAEYRYMPSRSAGDFQTSLSYWTMTRIFSGIPVLNQSFIEADPTTRIYAVEAPDVDKVYAHIFHRIKATRKMPKYGTPSF